MTFGFDRGFRRATDAPTTTGIDHTQLHDPNVAGGGDLVEEDGIEEGYIEIPEEPGLGVTLDMDAVDEHMVEGEELFD